MIPARALRTIRGETVPIPDYDCLVHLQFRRFAGCPVSDPHLESVVQRHQEVVAAGVRAIVVFHSTAEKLREHEGRLPFAVVADPGKRPYCEFGVESSPRSLLHPRALLAIGRGVARSLGAVVLRTRCVPPLNPEGGRYGLPANFLIAPDGRVCACKYGVHADDQWSLDEILTHASSACRAAAEPRAVLASA